MKLEREERTMQQKYVDGSSGLSVRQLKILTFIQRYSETFGYAPTVRDIRDSLEISSTSVVGSDLRMLRRGGFINSQHRAARTVSLTQNGLNLLWKENYAGPDTAAKVQG